MFKKQKTYIIIFLISLVCVNPPILNLVNAYAEQHPLLLGYPTIWIWLQFWYILACAFFLIGCIVLPSWNKAKYKEAELS